MNRGNIDLEHGGNSLRSTAFGYDVSGDVAHAATISIISTPVKGCMEIITSRIAEMSIDRAKDSPSPAPDKEQAYVNPDQIYVDWIIDGLKRSNGRLNRRGLARALGIDPSAATKILNGTRRIKTDEVRKAAAFLGSPAPDAGLAATQKENESVQVEPAGPLAYVPVRGETAGGRWLEYDVEYQVYDDVPVVPTSHVGLEQFAYRVSGNSMEKAKILSGDYVICVPYFMARVGMTDNDIVVVERRRAGLYERTCKRLKVNSSGASLVAESNDPRHEEPLFISGGLVPPDTSEIEIVGLVIGRYSKL